MRRPDSRAPLITFAATVVVAVIAFGWYVVAAQRIADQRYERQRDAICKVLASLPGRHPLPSIDHLRAVEARTGHPSDCYPIARSTAPRSPHAAAPPSTTVLIVPSGQPQPSPRPTPARTASPGPTPSHSPTPRPSPSPSGSCTLRDLLHDPTRCLHL